MSSTQNDRLKALLNTFKLANQARWSVGSTTRENKLILKRAADKAEETYLNALNQALSANGAVVEQAYQSVKSANKTISERLKNKSKVLKRIEAIQDALDKGLKLVQKATGEANGDEGT